MKHLSQILTWAPLIGELALYGIGLWALYAAGAHHQPLVGIIFGLVVFFAAPGLRRRYEALQRAAGRPAKK